MEPLIECGDGWEYMISKDDEHIVISHREDHEWSSLKLTFSEAVLLQEWLYQATMPYIHESIKLAAFKRREMRDVKRNVPDPHDQ